MADARHPGRCRSVERRAGEVHAGYVKSARAIDRGFCGTAVGEIGPVERRLGLFGEVRPLVVGAFGEHNVVFEKLVATAADSGAEKHWRRMRCLSPAHCRGVLVAMLRRTLGMAAVRANAQLLQRRFAHIGGVDCGVVRGARGLCKWRRRDRAGENYGLGGRARQ